MYLLIRQSICLFLLATLIGCGDTEQKPSADAPEEQQTDAISTSETKVASEVTGAESTPELAGVESTPEPAEVESIPEPAGTESTPELAGVESTPEPAALSAKDATVPAGSTSPPRGDAQPEQQPNDVRETDLAWQTDFDTFLQAFDKSVRANPGRAFGDSLDSDYAGETVTWKITLTALEESDDGTTLAFDLGSHGIRQEASDSKYHVFMKFLPADSHLGAWKNLQSGTAVKFTGMLKQTTFGRLEGRNWAKAEVVDCKPVDE